MRREPMTRRSDAGVTLIEMLVALVLFAMIGAAGFTVLDTVLKANTRTEGRLGRLADWDRAFLLLSRDLAQKQSVDLEGGEALRFDRFGPDGPVTVQWMRIPSGALVRKVILPDGADPVDQVLIDATDGLRWRFLGSAGWRGDWPPEIGGGTLRAIELALDLPDASPDSPPLRALRLFDVALGFAP